MSKHAVVVGATGYLGQAVATELLDRGWTLDHKWLDREHRTSVMDQDAFDTEFETVNAVVYLPGLNILRQAKDLSEYDFKRILDVNLTGAFLCARDLFPKLRTGSSFIAISSIMATHPYPFRVGYAAAKAGLEGLIRALAVEWGPLGISTHGLRLGHLDRLMTSVQGSGDLLEAVRAHTPGGKLLSPADAASYIGWLVDGGCASVSGQVADFDNGYCLNRWPLQERVSPQGL